MTGIFSYTPDVATGKLVGVTGEYETLASRVRRLRLARGWSQNELARRVEMSRQHVFEVERGGIQRLQGETLRRYADALGISERYLELGFEPRPLTSEELPTVEVVLRQNAALSERDVQAVLRFISALEAEQRLEMLLNERERGGADTGS